MVIITVEPPAELAVANPLRLAGDIADPASTADIPVIGNAPALNSEWPYVRIDDEWIRVTGIEGGVLHVAARGVRGTVGTTHNAGARVLIGFTFSRIFNDPASRDYWGQ